jgi:hypothetical protein
MGVVRADQNPVPFPAAGFRWLDEQQHLALEEVRGEPTKHPLGEEGRVLDKRLENPLVFERFGPRCRVFQPRDFSLVPMAAAAAAPGESGAVAVRGELLEACRPT